MSPQMQRDRITCAAASFKTGSSGYSVRRLWHYGSVEMSIAFVMTSTPSAVTQRLGHTQPV